MQFEIITHHENVIETSGYRAGALRRHLYAGKSGPSRQTLPKQQSNKTLSDDCWEPTSILEVARRVADWQIKDFPNNRYAQSEPRGWIAGALYMGMFDWATLSGENSYFDWLRKSSIAKVGR